MVRVRHPLRALHDRVGDVALLVWFAPAALAEYVSADVGLASAVVLVVAGLPLLRDYVAEAAGEETPESPTLQGERESAWD